MSLCSNVYYYSHGSTSQKNRKIEFIRPLNDPTKIYAKVSALKENGNWIVLSLIKEDKVSVMLDSITKKVEPVGHKIITKPPTYSALNNLSLEEQNRIIFSLLPLRNRSIKIINTFSGHCPYEIPVGLEIIDPK
ncbi:MAG: hypothetical protein K940chlam5_01326 [Candidatus Anoxychlamydiales bacterium]|nr:hypothetical protein [Candidatus Anoxychlamydiales bacterium]